MYCSGTIPSAESRAAASPPIAQVVAFFGREEDRREFVRGERLSRERRKDGGKGLRGPGVFAGNVARRDGTFFDRPDGFAGDAIKDEHKAVLRRLRNGVDGFAVAADGDELRRGGGIVVPEIVMNELEMPEALAGAGVGRSRFRPRCGRPPL